MDWAAEVEGRLARLRAEGRATRREAEELHQRLDLLALNMTVTGAHGEIPTAVAAMWVAHYHTDRTCVRHAASALRQARARQWLALGKATGVLRADAGNIEFAEPSAREYFCLHFLRTHPLDARLLRLAARGAFAPFWRRWAEQDASLSERLIALVQDAPDLRVRAHAARVLDYARDARAVEPLVAALGDPSNAVRVVAAGALAAYDNPRVMEQLVNVVVQAPHALRPPLCEAIGRAGEPGVALLVGLLAHRDWLVRRAAIIGLGQSGSANAVEPLLHHPVYGIYDSVTDDHVAKALARLGEPAVAALIAGLDHEQKTMRDRARRALARLGYANAAGPLLALLKRERRRGPDHHVLDIGPALVNQATPENAGVFVEALAEPDEEVRLFTALALVRIGDRRAFEPLRGLLACGDHRVRERAEEGLGELGDPRAVGPLIAALATASER